MTRSSTDLDGAEHHLAGGISPQETLFWVFKTRFVVAVYEAFLGFRPLCSEKPADGSSKFISRIHARMTTSIQCLKVRQSRGVYCQKLFVGTFSASLRKATEHAIGAIRK